MININNYDAIYLFNWLYEIATNNKKLDKIFIENYMWSDYMDENFLKDFIGYTFQVIPLGEHESYSQEVDYEFRIWNPRGEETLLRTSMSYKHGWNSIERITIK